jgi:hypothetical protein
MIMTGVARTGGKVTSLKRLARCSGKTTKLKEPVIPIGIDCTQPSLRMCLGQSTRALSAVRDVGCPMACGSLRFGLRMFAIYKPT